MREMTNAEGGFSRREDADSVPPELASDPQAHKTEGAFYLWTQNELQAMLGADFEVFRFRFGIRPDGNAPEDPQEEFAGKNLLYAASSIDEVAERSGKSRDEVEASLQRARMALFQQRLARPRPHLDDKVLTGWNGLMLAAFARASRVVPSAESRRPFSCGGQAVCGISRAIHVGPQPADSQAPLPRYAMPQSMATPKTSLPRVWRDRAVSSDRRRPLARAGADAPAAAG